MGDLLYFLGAEGLAVSEELNRANDREAITQVHLAEALQYRLKLELMRGFIIKRFANVSTERKKFSDLFMNMENLDSNHLITS